MRDLTVRSLIAGDAGTDSVPVDENFSRKRGNRFPTWHRLMCMKRRHVPAITLPLLASLGLIATACGDDPDASGPPVLVVTGTGTNSPSAASDMAMGSTESKMMAPYAMKFVAGADLPALDSDATSYSLTAGSYSVDDVESVATVFGVSGDVVEVDANMGGGYRIGSEDGSTDSFWVSDDAMGYWYFSPKYDESMMNRGCTISASPDGSVSSEPVECVTPEPPANVPSEDEARALFATMVSEMDMNADDMVLESYADEWSSSVYGYLKIDGVRSPLTVNIGFGAQGAVTWASGFLGEIVEGATYPRIGTTAALERLNTEFANPMMRGGAGLAIDDVAVTDIATSDMAVSEVVPATEVPVEGIPTTDVAIEGIPAPDATIEVQEVSIVAVEEELVSLYGQDGSIYLVPGYAFIAAEDEYGYTPRYTVSALPDEYVQQADPIAVVAEPAVIEPAPIDPIYTEIGATEAETLVGLSETEAFDLAKANGWEVRVVSRDGVDEAVTMDYRMDRVNLTIVDDTVTNSTVG